jgi:hypothetical protein
MQEYIANRAKVTSAIRKEIKSDSNDETPSEGGWENCYAKKYKK